MAEPECEQRTPRNHVDMNLGDGRLTRFETIGAVALHGALLSSMTTKPKVNYRGFPLMWAQCHPLAFGGLHPEQCVNVATMKGTR